MKFDTASKQQFIADSLYHELRCLMGAATVWQALRASGAGFDVVVAMDSAFVHARCLLNFFTASSSNDISVIEFGPDSPYPSTVYDTWREPLHRHVLHVNKGRAGPTNLQGGAHLNEQVEVLAHEVVRLWKALEADPDAKHFVGELRRARELATADAANDATGRTQPLFS